jgi:hypothetical protein
VRVHLSIGTRHGVKLHLVLSMGHFMDVLAVALFSIFVMYYMCRECSHRETTLFRHLIHVFGAVGFLGIGA